METDAASGCQRDKLLSIRSRLNACSPQGAPGAREGGGAPGAREGGAPGAPELPWPRHDNNESGLHLSAQ